MSSTAGLRLDEVVSRLERIKEAMDKIVRERDKAILLLRRLRSKDESFQARYDAETFLREIDKPKGKLK